MSDNKWPDYLPSYEGATVESVKKDSSTLLGEEFEGKQIVPRSSDHEEVARKYFQCFDNSKWKTWFRPHQESEYANFEALNESYFLEVWVYPFNDNIEIKVVSLNREVKRSSLRTQILTSSKDIGKNISSKHLRETIKLAKDYSRIFGNSRPEQILHNLDLNSRAGQFQQISDWETQLRNSFES